MKVAIIYNEDMTGVINQFGMQNKEIYNPKTVKQVADALEHGGHNVRILDGNMQIIDNIQEFMPRVIEGERMGMVFNMAYGIQGESRYTHLPAMLEMLGIPYVGSTPTGHAIALDKVITKILMQKNHIPTPEFWVFSSPEEDITPIFYPAIVKPKMESVSFGLRIVNDENELRSAVSYIIEEFEQQALVESFIKGREFCVGLLGNDNIEAFPILEIDLGDNPDAIQSVEEKLNYPRSKICPANISEEMSNKMIKLSKSAFKVLGLRDFARVDIRTDKNNDVYLLEINSMASLGLTGSYVHAAKVGGYDFKKLINKILDIAVIRYFSESNPQFENTVTNVITKKSSISVRIRGFLRSHQQRDEDLLKKMININSYFRNVEGVNALGNLVWRQLRPLGFYQLIIPQVEVGNFQFFSNVSEESFDVLLLTHLDCNVVFKRQVHFRETEHRLYGTSIWVNKGGLMVLISALQALRFIRLLRKIRIGILLTSDYTLYGRLGKIRVAKYANLSKFVIGLKGGGIDGTIITSRSGAAVYNCQMNLEKAERAGDVANAVASFSKLMGNWAELTNESEGVIVTLSEAEIKSNIADLYAHGETLLSVRFNEQQQAEEIHHRIQQITTKWMKRKLRIQVEGGMRRPPMVKTEMVNQLWNRIKMVANLLDIRLIEEHRWSSADVCFVNQKHVIDGMGPIGSDAIGKEEFIFRHSLLERATLLAMVIYDLYQEAIT